MTRRNTYLGVLAFLFLITVPTLTAEARYYQPTMGRWTTRDPAGPSSDINLYGYVRQRPTTSVDYAGLDSSCGAQFYGQPGADGSPVIILTTNGTAYPAGTMTTLDSMSDVAVADGVAVSYDMAAYWLSVSGDHSQTAWNRFAQEHNANQNCGPDVTNALSQVLKEIESFYVHKVSWKRCDLCESVFGVISQTKDVAWDINELFGLSAGPNRQRGAGNGSFKQPSRSVSVNGKCYDAAAVNYVMYGKIASLCQEFNWLGKWGQEMKAGAWKRLAYGHGVDGETKAWYEAGYDGWSTSSSVYSFTPYKVGQAGTLNKLNFTWLPYMKEGKEGWYERPF